MRDSNAIEAAGRLVSRMQQGNQVTWSCKLATSVMEYSEARKQLSTYVKTAESNVRFEH